MKYELGGQIMKELLELTAKKHSYLKENNDANKKAKGTKKWPVKWLRIIKTV